ncbi:hypothetical protein MMC17_006407 [Xylographa soralifera]|nr:hypothetical protein [Xylographa soralifera]
MEFNSSLPSHPQDGSDDHGSLLSVVSFFLLASTTLVVLTRLGTKWAMSHKLALDDGLIIASMLFATAQTVLLSLAVTNQLGDSAGSVDQSRQEALEKV